ncbi:unnamed protein product [Cladocopium goreaui]|uniref:Ribosomal large subunit pseudouridine synthase D n=1 Tax=Cladocopium goreaui TaxID=2562237 RepID=A0A9P1DP63_9DINO|nr:unnamed protein product [Cladocopium goreaui]
MATVKEEDRAKLEKFDGTDPSAYKRWRRKAELMLLALPNTFEKSRWGPKLCEYVSGEAEELIEDISISELCQEGGYKQVLSALDQKYSKRKEEEVQQYLKEYFYRCTIRQNETFRQFVVRLETTYKKLAEHGIELPPTVKGWMLMKKMNLDMTQEALILTSTSGSLKYEDVTTALTKVLPEGKCLVQVKSKDIFVTENQEDEPREVYVQEDEAADVFEAVAEMVQECEGEYEDALDAYETYAEIRKRMQSQKVARGFRTPPTPHLHLTGTMQAKIQQMKDKTRCHICRALGHWKRECPKKDKGSGKGTKSYGKRAENMPKETHDAMVADYELQGARGSEQEELSDIDAEALKSQFHEAFFTDDSVSELETLLAQDVQKGGTSSSSQFSKVFECNFADSDAHGLESYMCDAQGAHDCSLSTHAVPDTACRKTLVGQQTLEGIENELGLRGKKVHRFDDENVFRFGNDGCLKTVESVLIPVMFKHRSVVIRAAVLPGKGAHTRQKKDMEEEMIQKANNLDLQPDQPSDEPEEEGLGNEELETGKHKGMGFSKVYKDHKEYVAWVRENVEPSKKKFTAGMLKFRLYVEARDKKKKQRLSQITGTRPMVPMFQEKDNKDKGIRRSKLESEWEEIMDQSQTASPAQSHTARLPTQEDMLLQMKVVQEQMKLLNQTIQNATNQKAELEGQMMEMKKYMEKKQ